MKPGAFEVSGAVAVITGASCGIGAAAAVALAERGARVVAVARRPAALAATVEQCRYGGAGAIAVACDLAQPGSASMIVGQAVDVFGRVDVLVNNAGQHVFKAVLDTSVADVKSMFDTNFFAAMGLTSAVLPCMLEQGKGAIVNVTSVTAYLPDPGEAAYGASKAALSLWSHGLAMRLADEGIRVSVISPGPIATETVANTDEYYSGRRWPAADVAAAIVRTIERGTVHRTVPRRFGAPAALYPLLGGPIRAGLQRARRTPTVPLQSRVSS